MSLSVLSKLVSSSNVITKLQAGTALSALLATGAVVTTGSSSANSVISIPVPKVMPLPAPVPQPIDGTNQFSLASPIWEKCVGEGGTCVLPYKTNIRFGVGEKWVYRQNVSGSIPCSYRDLGDPAPGSYKECWYQTPGDAKAPLANAAGFKLGVNLTTVTYYSGEPTLANLLTGSSWDVVGADIRVDPVNGIFVPKGQRARRLLTTPPAVLAGQNVKAVCTWEGTADITLAGRGNMTEKTSNSVAINWVGWTASERGALVWMDVFSTGAEGAKNFDCRVVGMPRDAVLAPEVVDSLKAFKVLRFLDWSNVNANPAAVTWATRTLPNALTQADSPTGIAIEHMIALVKATGAAPWFNVPWNADEDYQRRMAKLVHDSLPADRDVYVELSNEVWNDSFGVTGQARKEGLAEGLSTDAREVVILRYAEKVRWMMGIWSQVFADRPGKLVKIGGAQTGASSVETMLGKGKLAGVVDAVAIAPYIGGNLMSQQATVTDTAALLGVLSGEVVSWESAKAMEVKNVTRKYNTRVVMYEGGQHLTGSDVDKIKQVNQAQGIYDVYRAYIGTWKAQVNDTMVLYNSTSPISRYGAWGIQEYVGQPLSDAPKRRAALEFAD